MKQTTKTMLSIVVVLAMLLAFTSMEILSKKKETIKKRHPLELRYIANEGVMLSSAKGKVLIDALFNNPHPNYNAPSEETLKMILDGHTETYNKFKQGEETIDLALVHFWFSLVPEGSRILQEILHPEHTELIHLPKRLESDVPAKINMVWKHYKDIFLLLPDTAPKIFQ